MAINNTQIALPGKATETSLTLPKNLRFEDWKAVGKQIARAEKAIMWWMGDWWNYGERHYGDRSEVADESDYSYASWQKAALVAKAYEIRNRFRSLPFSFHMVIVDLPTDKRQRLLERAAAEGWSRRDLVRAARRVKAGARSSVEFPKGKYRVIYADPPWEYGNEQPEYHIEQADHYPLMTLQEICDLPVAELAIEDAVLFLWVTSPILSESFEVVTAWGFEYKSAFIWDKVKHNMGHYNSVRHELLLVCVRGSCTPDERKLFDSVQSIERTEHSRKPEEFRRIIDTLYTSGPRIELFNRGSVPKPWERWGNE